MLPLLFRNVTVVAAVAAMTIFHMSTFRCTAESLPYAFTDFEDKFAIEVDNIIFDGCPLEGMTTTQLLDCLCSEEHARTLGVAKALLKAMPELTGLGRLLPRSVSDFNDDAARTLARQTMAVALFVQKAFEYQASAILTEAQGEYTCEEALMNGAMEIAQQAADSVATTSSSPQQYQSILRLSQALRDYTSNVSDGMERLARASERLGDSVQAGPPQPAGSYEEYYRMIYTICGIAIVCAFVWAVVYYTKEYYLEIYRRDLDQLRGEIMGLRQANRSLREENSRLRSEAISDADVVFQAKADKAVAKPLMWPPAGAECGPMAQARREAETREETLLHPPIQPAVNAWPWPRVTSEDFV